MLVVTIEFPEPELWDYFRARHIATDINGAFCIDLHEPGQTALNRLRQRRFDQAPVVSEPTRVVGWVAVHQLGDKSAVESSMTPLDGSAIVSTESPIEHVLQLLGEHGLVFTVGDHGLAGFIVHSDLDRQPARTHFYLLVSGIEILLADIIKVAYPTDSLIRALKSGMAKQYDRAKAANTETHPVEYLYLTALVELFLESPRVRRAKVLDESSIDWLKHLNKFRVLVMHPACSIAAARSPTEIAQFSRSAADVIDRLQELSRNFRATSHGEVQWKPVTSEVGGSGSSSS